MAHGSLTLPWFKQSPSLGEGFSEDCLKPRSFRGPSQSLLQSTGQHWLSYWLHFSKTLISDVTPWPLPWAAALLQGMKEPSWAGTDYFSWAPAYLCPRVHPPLQPSGTPPLPCPDLKHAHFSSRPSPYLVINRYLLRTHCVQGTVHGTKEQGTPGRNLSFYSLQSPETPGAPQPSMHSPSYPSLQAGPLRASVANASPATGLVLGI